MKNCSLRDFANPILAFICCIKANKLKNNINDIRIDIMKKIIDFEKTSIEEKFSEKIILASRYCLCAAIDEFIALSEWDDSTQWVHQSLLKVIHNETWGGERFFTILDSALSNGKTEDIFLVEIIYILLCLGYEGKYYNQDKNKIKELMDKSLCFINNDSVSHQIHNIESHPAINICKKYNKKIYLLIAPLSLAALLVINYFSYVKAKNSINIINHYVNKYTYEK